MALELLKDIDGKPLELGHIVIVRYGWNSYVGQVTDSGLSATGARRHAFFSPHTLSSEGTYQIISHFDFEHKDYNKEVNKWYYRSEVGDCPVKIRVYDITKQKAKKSVKKTMTSLQFLNHCKEIGDLNSVFDLKYSDKLSNSDLYKLSEIRKSMRDNIPLIHDMLNKVKKKKNVRN